MSSVLLEAVRPRSYAAFERPALMRGQNFWVEWVDVPKGGSSIAFQSEFESLLISAATPLQLSGEGTLTAVAAHTVSILPAGRHMVAAAEAGSYAFIASQRGDIAGRTVVNAEAYAEPDPRIVPAGRPFRRREPLRAPQVLEIDAIRAAPDRPRLKMLQTETLSINIVEYRGVRDRTALSPHNHAEFEQGSLALAGDFVHHLRVSWGVNANLWRDDEHLAATSPSLLVVPVQLIHTTEGIGDGHHLLIDVFAPPRRDFIGKGWVFNAGDYVASEA